MGMDFRNQKTPYVNMNFHQKDDGLKDLADYAALASRAFVSDEFTKCFQPLHPDNLYDSGLLYLLSVPIRYLILLPLRLCTVVVSLPLFLCMLIKGTMNKDRQLTATAFLFLMRVLALCLGLRINISGRKRRLRVPHVFVANHTSFLDFVVLSVDRFCHASVAENHGGLFGFLYNGILKLNGCVSFKRSEKTDKDLVRKKIRRHVRKNRAPLLVFPEGTCTNNRYSVMYQKGAFDLGVTVVPIAMRYKTGLLDPYWNRKRFGFTMMLLYYMSRWFVEVDVTYLDPTHRKKGEDTVAFARRVKKSISKTAGLVDTQWNGYLKSNLMVKDRMIMRDAYLSTYEVIIERREKMEAFKRGIIGESEVPKLEYAEEYDCKKYFDGYGYLTFLNIVLDKYFYIKKYHSKEYDKYEDIEELMVGFDEIDYPECQCE